MVSEANGERSIARGFRVPHTLVLLFGIMVLAWIATWLLPQGSFETALNDQGRTMVVPGTYTESAERVRLAPWELFTAVPRAMADAQAIIFFLLIVGGAIAVLRATGTIDAGLGWILRRVGHSPALLITSGSPSSRSARRPSGLPPSTSPSPPSSSRSAWRCGWTR
jgi:uncharacterized ion transporter superfamily protein YfcC